MIPIMKKRADIKNQKYQKAIRLKYESFSYPEIAKLLKVSEITVKRWFRPDGLLKDEYDAYERETNTLTDSVVDTILKTKVEVAAKMLVALMGSKKDTMKFRAAKTILDYCFGKTGVSKESEYEDEDQGKYLELEKILEKIRRKSTDK